MLTAALNGFEKKVPFLLSRALGSDPLNLAIDAPQESQENRHMWPSQHKERVVKASRASIAKECTTTIMPTIIQFKDPAASR